eukprot:Opistho-2@11232
MRDLPLPTLPFSDIRPPQAERRSLPATPGRLGTTRAAPARLDVAWARSEDEVREAQALRYRIFVDEMGARLALPAHAPAGHDIDRFDPFCEHLLVRSVEEDGPMYSALI